MHCKICDALLTDFEATRRNANTNQFLDICNHCFAESGLKDIMPTRDRKDLVKESDFDLEDFPEAYGGHYNNYVDYEGDIEDNC